MKFLLKPRRATPRPLSRLETLEARDVPAIFANPTTQTFGTTLNNNGHVATGDFNGDGNLDLVLTNYGSSKAPGGSDDPGNSVTVMFGTSTGSFTGATSYSVGGGSQFVSFAAVADVNADNKLDIVAVHTGTTSGGSASSYSVFLNNGNGTFGAPTTVLTGSSNATWVGVTDLNGDNIKDIAITHLGRDNGASNIDKNNVTVYFGQNTGGVANGQFSLSNTYTTNFEFIPTAGAFLDIDGDGDLDLAVTIPTAPPDDTTPQGIGKIGQLINNGGVFTISGSYPSSEGFLPISIVAADVDNNGKMDLIVANAGDPDVGNFGPNASGTFGQGTNVAIITNSGFGSFSTKSIITASLRSSFAVASGDFNLDGNADVAIADLGAPLGISDDFTQIHPSENGSLAVYTGNGAGGFSLDQDYTYNDYGTQYLAIGDFDNKGNPDIVTVGLENRTRTSLNTTRATSTTLVASSNNAPNGTNITFTATTAITGGYTNNPTGSVDFYDGTTKIGSGTLAVVGTDYKASFATNLLGIGSHSITAKYVGQFTSSPFVGISTSLPQSVTITSAANTNPTISGLSTQNITVGGNTGALAFTVGDAETPLGSLTLSASSSNTTAVPVGNIVFGGSGANRTVTITGAAAGSSTITLTVTDGGSLTAQTTFTVNVTAANTPPTISTINSTSISTNSTTGPIAFTIGDAETPAANLTLSVASDNTLCFPLSAITFGGSGANRTITVNSNANAGSGNITITVTDAGGLTVTRNFIVTANGGGNTNPTISDIPNAQINQGATLGPVSFTVGDAETPAGSLTLTATSSNPTLVPNGNISFGGSGTNRTLFVIPASGQSGSATITVTVSDGSLIATDTFTLVVVPPNTAPTISDIIDRTTPSGTAVGPIPFTIGDAETAPGSLIVTGSSSNTTLVPNGNISFGGSGANRTLFILPASGQSGTTTITVSVSDGVITTTDTFVLTVTPPNTPPTISDITDKSTAVNVAVGPIGFTVGDTETTTASLTLTGGSTNPALLPASNITFGGSGANRTVTLTPVAGQTGTTTVTITVTDGGGLSTSDTFVLTVNAANTPPTITAISNQSGNAGSSFGPLSFTIGDAQTAPDQLIISGASTNGSVVPNAFLTFGGSGANRTVSFNTIAAGTTTITLTVSDGSQTASTSFTVTTTTPPVNTPPTISAISDRTIFRDSTTGAITFTIGDAESAADTLTISANSNNPTLVPSANVVLAGSGTSRTITVTPAAGQTGTADISITVGDGQNTVTEVFTLTVNPPTAPGRAREFAIASDAGRTSTVRFFNPDQTERFTLTPFGPDFTGGIRTASADFTGDDIADLVVASGPGIAGTVRVIDGVTAKTLFEIQPFGETFVRGIVVSAGDMTNDGRAEVIITAESGGGARVRIFSPNTAGVFSQKADFIALIGGDGIADTKFRGGGRSTVGDFNGDGFGDLAFAAGTGGGPRVALFDGKSMTSSGSVKLRGDFFAFEPNLRNGTYISAGDMDADGFAELVCGAGPGGGPRVTVFDGENLVANKEVKLKDFFAGNVDNRGGIRVTVKNLNNDGASDLLAGAGPGGGSRATSYSGSALLAPGTPNPLFDFDAFPGFGGGVYVG